MRKAQEILDSLLKWAGDEDLVRGMILSSARVDGEDHVDLLSDYDVKLYVKDLALFMGDDDWLEAFGPVMTLYPSEPQLTDIGELFRLVIYHDGIRIDWCVATAESMDELNGDPEPYRVLIDKDGLVKNPVRPYHSAYHVQKPSKAEYDELIADFWWDIIYVAKALWRDELYWAKYMNRKVH